MYTVYKIKTRKEPKRIFFAGGLLSLIIIIRFNELTVLTYFVQAGPTPHDDPAGEASHRGDGEAHRQGRGCLRGRPQVRGAEDGLLSGKFENVERGTKQGQDRAEEMSVL